MLALYGLVFLPFLIVVMLWLDSVQPSLGFRLRRNRHPPAKISDLMALVGLVAFGGFLETREQRDLGTALLIGLDAAFVLAVARLRRGRSPVRWVESAFLTSTAFALAWPALKFGVLPALNIRSL